MQLSKSDYMLFLKHPAWLWLKKNDKKKLPEHSEDLQALFDDGKEFEEIAEKLFAGAKRLGFNNFDEYLNLPFLTKQALEQGAETILQGRFEADGLTCIVDVLKKAGEGEYDLYEIKSSSDVKPEHIHDLAFQVVVLEKAGLKVNNVFVTHVNRDYVRDGEIDPEGITVTKEVTEKVRGKIEETEKNIQEALEVAALDECPDISPRHFKNGYIKEWIEVYEKLCGGFDKYSIYNLASPNANILGELEDMGIESIGDIPAGVALTDKQKWQVEATKTGKRNMDKEKISEFLETFEYPLYFLDYETLGGCVPAFDGLRPRQQVPFQYSLHVLKSPDAEVEHYEYLHMENTNPAKPLAEKLKEHMGNKGSVVVWYEAFEKSCNKVLAELSPEHKEFLNDVNERIVDLMVPFFEGWFVDKDFFGSASIKKVLPALVPELSYKELGVQEGGAAQRVWMETVLKGKNGENREKVFNDLIEYCKLDTLAMVEIYKKLKEEI